MRDGNCDFPQLRIRGAGIVLRLPMRDGNVDTGLTVAFGSACS